MADTPLQLIVVGEAEGYCDAETGVCALPAPRERPTDAERPTTTTPAADQPDNAAFRPERG